MFRSKDFIYEYQEDFEEDPALKGLDLNGVDVKAIEEEIAYLNNLIKKLKEEEKSSKRNNLVISAAALSAVAVFGIIMTL